MNKKISFAKEILREFLKPRFRYKGIPVNFLGLPAFYNNHSKVAFSKVLSRFKQKGLIEKDGEFLCMTQKGREYIKRRQDSLNTFSYKFPKSSPKNLIVMFDIPEVRKAEREWFRFHLKKFGYVMIQKSVWVGPSPLPADFLEYLKEIKLKNCIKTFKLAKPYQQKDEL